MRQKEHLIWSQPDVSINPSSVPCPPCGPEEARRCFASPASIKWDQQSLPCHVRAVGKGSASGARLQFISCLTFGNSSWGRFVEARLTSKKLHMLAAYSFMRLDPHKHGKLSPQPRRRTRASPASQASWCCPHSRALTSRKPRPSFLSPRPGCIFFV